MQNKKGNIAMVAIIVMIVAITAGVIGYMFAKKTQAPAPQAAEIKQPTLPVAETQLKNQQVNTDISWKLISGKSGDSCSGLVYDGAVTVKGWYVLDTGYANKEWMLQIADSDLNKFPKEPDNNSSNINKSLKLIDASPEIQKELKSATKDNPTEITLKGYYLYCEGAPVVSIAPATESFKQYIKIQTSLDKTVLQNSVFSAVDNANKAKYAATKDPGYKTWDKKVDITSIDPSQKAAEGKWWAKDAWDWIAWQQDDNSWKVLVSFDGFNCKELDNVPSQYNAFFHNIIYQLDNKKYCY